MAGPRTVLIINPQSQAGALARRWSHLSDVIRRELGSFEEARTQGPGDATTLTRQAIEDGVERVVAVGGDGTINEVANGFFRDGEPIMESPTLGIIPFGTGGDFRKTARIPNDPALAARIIAGGQTRRIDMGKLEYKTLDGDDAVRMFINIASFGLSGLVDRYVNQGSKRLGGKLSFFIASMRATLDYQNQRVHLEFDGDPSDAVDMIVSTVAVANGRYFGGGMFVAPDAELSDGFFDVVALGDFTLRDVVLRGPRLYKGTHLSMDKVSHRRAKIVRAEALGEQDVALDVDGETPGVLPATFTLLPEALTLIAPV